MKKIEVIFDLFYIISAFTIGFVTLARSTDPVAMLTGVMVIVLIGGDSFHLVPRIIMIVTDNYSGLMLGRGKQITSVTMTFFYVMMWQLSQMIYMPSHFYISVLVWTLAAFRIALCLFSQNGWTEKRPSVKWSIIRNVPFLLLGMIVALRFFLEKNTIPDLDLLWLAVVLSFAFYIPVVLWAHKYPKIGMLMIPKTCMYLWIIVILCF